MSRCRASVRSSVILCKRAVKMSSSSSPGELKSELKRGSSREGAQEGAQRPGNEAPSAHHKVCAPHLAQEGNQKGTQVSRGSSIRSLRGSSRGAIASKPARRQAGRQGLGRNSVGALPWRGLFLNLP